MFSSKHAANPQINNFFILRIDQLQKWNKFRISIKTDGWMVVVVGPNKTFSLGTRKRVFII